ncbi:MAG: winged helix-turn-helix transcriptional regulator [Sphingobium sp.]|nr:winged helix-turn-helix transcriptional regulator [Sphingobium sp.]
MAEEKVSARKDATTINPRSLEDNVGVRLIRLAEVFARLAKIGVEEPWGLRNTDLRILNTLDGAGSVPISEIARRTHVDKAWISRSVRELVEKGLVDRSEDPADSRVSLAILTTAGRDLLDRIRPSVIAAEKNVLQGIDEHVFKRDLSRLLANVEDVLDAAERQAGRNQS